LRRYRKEGGGKETLVSIKLQKPPVGVSCREEGLFIPASPGLKILPGTRELLNTYLCSVLVIFAHLREQFKRRN
jgi:hypothetical protein